jgi:hypothetical protein
MTSTVAQTADAESLSDRLAVAIREEHAAASAAANAALAHALEAGRLLEEARATIPHGNWEFYVQAIVGIAPRTARLYLRLHRHRDRLPNRQRVADLTVRQAAKLLEQPKAPPQPQSQERFDFLGEPWAMLTATGVVWNPDWRIVPFPIYEDVALLFDAKRPAAPAWYVTGHRHVAEHETGWCFEVLPDSKIPNRVNVIVHDASQKRHLAAFDGMVPAGIVPFLTACEKHRGMPNQDYGWTVSSMKMPQTVSQLNRPFAFDVFDLAFRPGHSCDCWVFVDQSIGATPFQEAGFQAWKIFGHALNAWVGAGHGKVHCRGLSRRTARQAVPA